MSPKRVGHVIRHQLLGLASVCLALLSGGASSALGADMPGELRLTLDEAIRLTLEKNYSIRIDALNVPIAQASVASALGSFDVKLKGSYTNAREVTPYLPNPLTGIRATPYTADTDTYSVSLAGLTPWGLSYEVGGNAVDSRSSSNLFSDQYSSFAGLSFTQPLLRGMGFGVNLYQVRVARLNRNSSEWEYRSTLTNTITDVIYAYGELQYYQAYLRSATRSFELATQLQRENEKRFTVGERSEFDILSAKAKVALRQDSMVNAQRYVRVAENALKQLISDQRNGALLNTHLILSEEEVQAPASLNPAAEFQAALARRPDYQQYLLLVKKGRLLKNYQINQLLPRVDLVGSYGYNGIGSDYRSSRDDVRTKDFPSYSTGVSVSIPLTSTSERAGYRSAKLQLQKAELNLERLEQDIMIQIGNAADHVETARRRVETTRRAREINDKVLEAEIKRLRAGTGTTFSVLYQQEQLNSAENYEASAKAEYIKALAEYDRQLGRTLEIRHIVIDSPRQPRS